jgi:hypothetical protein
MGLMDLETAFALLEADQIGVESLPDIATEALAEGSDSPSLRLLAGIAPFDPRDARDLFLMAMHELGIPRPNSHQAALIAARWLATECLNGAMSLEDGCRRIYRIFLLWIADHPGSDVPDEIQQLGRIGNFSEYYETPEESFPYGGGDQVDRELRLELEHWLRGNDSGG